MRLTESDLKFVVETAATRRRDHDHIIGLVLHADETYWRHDGQNYWNWYSGNDDLAFFHLDPQRSTEAAQSLLGEGEGKAPVWAAAAWRTNWSV